MHIQVILRLLPALTSRLKGEPWFIIAFFMQNELRLQTAIEMYVNDHISKEFTMVNIFQKADSLFSGII